VLGRQRIGPFDVTRLAANDPAVLANWLSDNGFPSPDGLEQNLAPYVADRWELVAIKLAPAEATGTMTGQLQPLTPSFTPDRVIFRCALHGRRNYRRPSTLHIPFAQRVISLTTNGLRTVTDSTARAHVLHRPGPGPLPNVVVVGRIRANT
jgi:hypothetical protein